jgi:hypothetical protein
MTSQLPSFQKGSSAEKPDRHRRRGPASPRQVENYWNLYKKGLSVAKPASGLPGWLLPLLATILIIALVFWAAPSAVARLQLHQIGQETSEPVRLLLYDAATRVVIRPVADVFDQPDLKAGRVTQVLYNEPVTQRDEACPAGFTAVLLSDGTVGYMMTADLTDWRESIEPARFSHKLVVIAATKRIMSHARQGTLLVEVMMGTILFIDYRGAGVSSVLLPDGTTGWISDDGAVVLDADGQIMIPAHSARAFCSSALTFRQVTVLANGQSIRGVSTTGIARLAGAVNGLELPRTLAGLSESGRDVPLALDPVSGLVDLTLLQPGDLVFLAAADYNRDEADQTADPVDLMIYVDTDQVLYARPSHTSIRVLDLTRNEDLWARIIRVRRLFT